MKAFTPRPYQREIIEHIQATPRCNVWSSMGSGKTVSVLTALAELDLVEDVFPALVVAPLRVATSTWPDEAAKWDHLAHLRVVAIAGSEEARRCNDPQTADIYTINYENLPWLIEELAPNGDWNFKTVVPDESTKLKGFRLRQGSKRAQALARVAHALVDRWINLTGTSAPNGLQDLWGQHWFVDRGDALGRTFKAFTDRWFRPVRMGAAAHAVRIVPHDFAQQQIEDRLRPTTITVDVADYLDIQEPVRNKIMVKLSRPIMRAYADFERQMFLELGDGIEVEAMTAAAKSLKCMQLANGAVYTDDAGGWEEVHRSKIDALQSVVNEAAGMPVLVAYHFKSDLARLMKAFPEGRHLDKDPQTIRDWNAGEIPLLFAHPASAGHGLNLQDGGNILAFFGLNWNLEEHMQIIERIGPTRQLQAGHNRPVFIHYIIAAGTVDELIMARLETKRGIQDLLLEAMKRRPLLPR